MTTDNDISAHVNALEKIKELNAKLDNLEHMRAHWHQAIEEWTGLKDEVAALKRQVSNQKSMLQNGADYRLLTTRLEQTLQANKDLKSKIARLEHRDR